MIKELKLKDLLQFSEPIYIDSLSNPFYIMNEDSLKLNLNYNYENPSLISLKSLVNNSIYIECDHIKDLNDNVYMQRYYPTKTEDKKII